MLNVFIFILMDFLIVILIFAIVLGISCLSVFNYIRKQYNEIQKYKNENAKDKLTIEEWKKLVNYRTFHKRDSSKFCKRCKFYLKASDSDYGEYEHGYCKLERKQGHPLDECTVYGDWSCKFFN